MSDKKFEWVNGLYVKEWKIDFVKAKLGIKVKDFIEYLEENSNSEWYVNIDILESKKGWLYAKLNTWKPEKQDKVDTTTDDEIPF